MNKQKIYLLIGVLLALSLVLVSVAEAVPGEKKVPKARLLFPTKTISYSSFGDTLTFDWTDVKNADSYTIGIWYSESGQENWVPIQHTEYVTVSNYEYDKALFPPGYDYRWHVVTYIGTSYSYSRDGTFSVVA
ncbi:hypothetical protein [Methanolobus sp. WCC4]|uniref:hypothetical protein n=1 Tax=Methanolobus sp. WCC4 TaxID=3125784 RepID=UPI0030F8ADC2